MKHLFVLALTIAATLTAQAAILTTQHVDLSMNFNAGLSGSSTNPWRLTVRDEDARIEYAGVRALFGDSEKASLLVAEAAMFEAPGAGDYAFLGEEGAPVWVLPQGQDPALLYLGISTEAKTASQWTGDGVSSDFLVKGITSGTFTSNRVTLTLASFSGPGNFFLYTTSAFGSPTISMRTDDGIGALDARQFSPGGHAHFNWAFTQPGEYVIGLQASGTLTSNGLLTTSDVTEFHFTVVPEPSALLCAVLGGGPLLFLRRRVRKPDITAHSHTNA